MRWFERIEGVENDEEHIRGFFEEYRFLSNFHLCEVEYEGLIYPSSENAYQAAKTLDLELRKLFTKCTPNKAKQLGRGLKLREDWDMIKLQVMYDICLDKFRRSPELKHKLLSTNPKHLEETNWWGDTYWGVCRGVGQNHLGQTLMMVRSELILEK